MQGRVKRLRLRALRVAGAGLKAERGPSCAISANGSGLNHRFWPDAFLSGTGD